MLTEPEIDRMLRNIRRLHLMRVLMQVFVYGDMNTIRAMLALGSIGWAAGLWCFSDTFGRPGYRYMAAFAPQWLWGFAFLLHFLGVCWRFIDRRVNVPWALTIHGFGLSLWIISTAALTVAVGEFTPSGALEWVLIAAGAMAFIRTGFNEEKITP